MSCAQVKTIAPDCMVQCYVLPLPHMIFGFLSLVLLTVHVVRSVE